MFKAHTLGNPRVNKKMAEIHVGCECELDYRKLDHVSNNIQVKTNAFPLDMCAWGGVVGRGTPPGCSFMSDILWSGVRGGGIVFS